MNKVHVKKDDTVSKGTKGKVLEVSPKEGKLLVKGVNIASKHVKPRKQGEQGGIMQLESAIYACKVALYCDKCGKGVRAKHSIVDGKKVRVCAKCGKEI